jgi:hypothetical protein
MTSNLYAAPSDDMCGEDLMADAVLSNSSTGNFARGSGSLEDYNGDTREDPNHGHDKRDPSVKEGGVLGWLRGTQ